MLSAYIDKGLEMRTFDFEGKLKQSSSNISELLKRMERNKEWIPERQTYYYPSRAVQDLISQMKSHRKILKEYHHERAKYPTEKEFKSAMEKRHQENIKEKQSRKYGSVQVTVAEWTFHPIPEEQVTKIIQESQED